jgi:hypothetical protein
MAFLIPFRWAACSLKTPSSTQHRRDRSPHGKAEPVEKPGTHRVCGEYGVSLSVGDVYELLDATIECRSEAVPLDFQWSGLDEQGSVFIEAKGETIVLFGVCRFIKTASRSR